MTQAQGPGTATAGVISAIAPARLAADTSLVRSSIAAPVVQKIAGIAPARSRGGTRPAAGGRRRHRLLPGEAS